MSPSISRNAAATAANARGVPRGAQAAAHRHDGLAPASVTSEFVKAARDIPLLVAPNTSIGVSLLIELVRACARALPSRLRHRDHRSASPRQERCAVGHCAGAGRAAATRARARPRPKSAVTSRAGAGARVEGDIGFAVIRGGDIVGEHTVLFAGPGEQLTLDSPGHRPVDLCPRRAPGGRLAGGPAGRAFMACRMWLVIKQTT